MNANKIEQVAKTIVAAALTWGILAATGIDAVAAIVRVLP